MIKKITLVATMIMLLNAQTVVGQKIAMDKTLRNWFVTVHGGLTSPYTDVRSYDWRRVMLKEGEENAHKRLSEYQYGVGASVTRMFGGVFGMQVDYMYGKLQGVTVNKGGFQEDRYFWKKLGFSEPVYFKTQYLHQPTINGYINLSNMFVGLNRYIRHKSKNKELNDRPVSVYAKAGLGFVFFKSQVYKVKDGEFYDANKRDAEPRGKYLVTYTNNVTEVTAPFALGLKIKAGKRFDIGLEGRFNYIHTDKLDAHVSNEYIRGRNDKFVYLNANVNYKFGSKKGQEEHLEWINPLEAYMSVTDAKLANLYTVKDADGDGVIDELDEEPESPEGAMVDTHGKTLDSDKDGIPDHLDPEPFSTPELPIVDGVNQRPDGLTPQMIKEVKEILGGDKSNKAIGWVLSLVFFDLDKDNIRTSEIPELYQIGTVMQKYPDLKVNVKGFTDIRNTDDYNMNLSDRRVQNVIEYLNEKYGIAKDRFVPGHFGEANNLFPGASTEQQHQLNRRVEVTPANY
jgi:outer membrane protein OmpA-like peptidoglycan-associated protein